MNSETRLSTRLLFLYSIIYLLMIGFMAIAVDRVASNSLIDDIEESLAVAGGLAFESLPADSSEYQGWAGDVFAISGFRTTLIDSTGLVLADSHSDPEAMENHAGREEIQEAFDAATGVARRVSASTGFDQLYVALPSQGDLVIRTSVPVRVINNDLNNLRWTIGLTGLLVGLVGVLAVAYWARRMARPIRELTGQAMAVVEGDLNVAPRRSSITEFDQLGLAISAMASRLGSRVTDAEQASATLDVVLSALPQGTILIGPNDTVMYANPAAEGLLGPVPENVGALTPHQFQTSVREARGARKPVRVDVDHGTPVRNLTGIATPFLEDERVLLLVIDITERERADSIRRDFVANASHELKTPVATIIASAEAMQIALARHDANVAVFADRVGESAHQLDRLVSDLLDLSRLEREAPDLGPARVDLLVREEVERAKGPIEDKQLDLTVDVAQVTATVSHRDLAIAVRNLLDNAIRYTNSGGRIEVGLASTDLGLEISVSDSGDGIPSRDIERVFERFYRVDSARSRGTGGTGLGLSIVKHVTESHGGSVGVESELGVGSTFTMRLPSGLDGEAPADN